MVTFIITLVVIVLITYIITSLCYKRWYKLKRNDKVDNKNKPYGDSVKMVTDPLYETVNPVYGIATIKMDTNPAYAATDF